ncbi:MAG: PAS domain S-box protein [Spirochaetales bacterium]|nr:PAS domain S-box protein [Spirochaetales bacterium]MCF7939934.1 PAS domain S-box protein [Spirochaetales bacterium]
MFQNAVLKDANPAALQLYEASSVRELADSLQSIIGEKGPETLEKLNYLLAAGERRFRVETTNQTVKGRLLHILLHVAVPDAEDGSPDFSGIMVYPKDITEGKQLMEQFRILSVLPEANPNIVIIMQCMNQIVYLNPAAKAWLHQKGLYDYEHIRSLLPEDFEQQFCGSCDHKATRSWSRAVGDRIYDIKLSPLPDGGRCMITATDVTEFERLSEEHKIFYRAFNSVHSAIMVTDREGSITFVNDYFEELYGYAPQEVIGRQPNLLNPGKEVYYELGVDHQSYEQLFSDLWRNILDPQRGYWEGDFYNQKADGSLVRIHAIIQAIRNEQDELIGFIAFPIDLTEKEEHERDLRLEIFRTIAAVAELRDNETGNHIIRVGRYARRLAEEMKMPRSYCEEIELFAPLHDIGKVGIPDSILLAPRKLSDEEFAQIQTHTVLGWELLKDKRSMEMAAAIAYGHHEQWDGKGYPKGLAGDEISIEAGITAVCDVYDALRSERPYKKAWSHEETVEEIRNLKGTKFKPELVDAFLSCEQCIADVYRELPD